MARITVEDCLERIPNLFDLVLTASKRARRLANGAEAMVEWENDKPTVVALREIADGHIDIDILEENEQQQALEAVFEDEPQAEAPQADHAQTLPPPYTRPAPSDEQVPSSGPATDAIVAPDPATEPQPAETAKADPEELTPSDIEAELEALMSAQPEEPTAAEPEPEAQAEATEPVEEPVSAEAAESAEPDTRPESSGEAHEPEEAGSAPPRKNPPE